MGGGERGTTNSQIGDVLLALNTQRIFTVIIRKSNKKGSKGLGFEMRSGNWGRDQTISFRGMVDESWSRKSTSTDGRVLYYQKKCPPTTELGSRKSRWWLRKEDPLSQRGHCLHWGGDCLNSHEERRRRNRLPCRN